MATIVSPLQNDCVPIAKLSPEILLRIFSLVQNTSWSPDPAHKISWIKVTHVCRYWRLIAIYSPTLWTTPSTEHQKWTAVMLQRSASAPLNIYLHYFALRKRIISLEEKHRKINIAVFTNLDRVRTLFLDMDYVSLTNLQKFLEEGPIVGLNASLLEEMSICSTPENPDRHPFHLKSTTFQKTDRLREIRLVESQIDWESLLLSNLTSFTYLLTSMAPELPQPPTWQEMADALARMPNLKTLHLRMPLPTNEIPSAQLIKSVNLSQLQHLTLDFEFHSQIRSFLSLITVGPSLEHVVVRCANYDLIPESYAITLRAISDALTWSFWERICSMRLSANWSSKGKNLDILDFFRTPLPAKDTVPSCVRLELPCKESDPKDGDRKISDIVDSVHLSNLTEVALLRMDLSSQALTTSFGLHPHLSSITVTGPTSLSLIEALTPVSYNVLTRRVQFAKLLAITIKDTILQRDAPDKDATQIRDNFERSIPQRQAHGAVLEKLQVVECCSTLSRTLENITGIDVDIDWEGMVSHYRDGSDDDEMSQEEEEEEEDDDDDKDDEQSNEQQEGEDGEPEDEE